MGIISNSVEAVEPFGPSWIRKTLLPPPRNTAMYSLHGIPYNEGAWICNFRIFMIMFSIFGCIAATAYARSLCGGRRPRFGFIFRWQGVANGHRIRRRRMSTRERSGFTSERRMAIAFLQVKSLVFRPVAVRAPGCRDRKESLLPVKERARCSSRVVPGRRTPHPRIRSVYNGYRPCCCLGPSGMDLADLVCSEIELL